MLRYSLKLTRTPWAMVEDDVAALRTAGHSDIDILHITEVVGYFAYANRTVSGLGVNMEGEVVGLSPGDSDDPENWGHQ